MGILEKLFEERKEDEFQYKTVTSKGKETEDPEKISKVIAVLKQSTSGKATNLAKKYEEILRKQKEIDKDLSEIKEKGIEFVEGLFDARDAIYTRAVETAKVVLTLSKETIRKTPKFDEEKFISKILALVPHLEKEIEVFKKECSTITETLVKSSLKPELKEEGFSDLIKKIKDYINKVVTGVKNWATGYDKKLNSIKKEFGLSDKMINGSEEEVSEPEQEKPEMENSESYTESFKEYFDRIL